LKTFALEASVNTDNPTAIFPALKRLIGKAGTVKKTAAGVAQHSGKGEFNVRASLEGESSKELNRALLSSLRAIEKKTRLRAKWTAQGRTESYFDYVLKKVTDEI
jgi:hypothetical protein